MLGRVWEKPDDTGRNPAAPDRKEPEFLRFLDWNRSMARIADLAVALDPVDVRRDLTVY